jgi:hypothetical protein
MMYDEHFCPDDDCEGKLDLSDGHPFGSDVQCELCKRWWETDWEHMGEEIGMPWWTTGKEITDNREA